MQRVGSNQVNIVAKSQASLPTAVTPGSWHVASENGGWMKAPAISATCLQSQQTEYLKYHISHKVQEMLLCAYFVLVGSCVGRWYPTHR
jgi:hypothetical protein